MKRYLPLTLCCALAGACLLCACAGPAGGESGGAGPSAQAVPSQEAQAAPTPETGAAPSQSERPAASPSALPGPEPDPSPAAPEDQGALFGALAGDSVMALVLLEPTAEELALAGEVEAVFPPQELGERMLIVPRLPDSTVIVQRLTYDQEGALTGAEEIWRSRAGAAGALLQQDIPEGYATLRVVVRSGERTGSYDVTYYGKGDGRRDFYVWLERTP